MKNKHQLTFIGDVMFVCEHHGLSVSSWYRHPAHNAVVGGHPKSRHLTWDAFDLVKPAVELKKGQLVPMEAKRARSAVEAAMTFLKGCGYYGYTGHHERKVNGKRFRVYTLHVQRQAPCKETR